MEYPDEPDTIQTVDTVNIAVSSTDYHHGNRREQSTMAEV